MCRLREICGLWAIKVSFIIGTAECEDPPATRGYLYQFYYQTPDECPVLTAGGTVSLTSVTVSPWNICNICLTQNSWSGHYWVLCQCLNPHFIYQVCFRNFLKVSNIFVRSQAEHLANFWDRKLSPKVFPATLKLYQWSLILTVFSIQSRVGYCSWHCWRSDHPSDILPETERSKRNIFRVLHAICDI